MTSAAIQFKGRHRAGASKSAPENSHKFKDFQGNKIHRSPCERPPSPPFSAQVWREQDTAPHGHPAPRPLWFKHEQTIWNTLKNQGHSGSRKWRTSFYSAGKQRQLCLRKIPPKSQQQRILHCKRVSSGFSILPARGLLQEQCQGTGESLNQITEPQSENCNGLANSRALFWSHASGFLSLLSKLC